MRKTIKNFTCFVFLFFLFVPLAVADSEYLEDWVDTWTVRMLDDSIVTWEITDTWVSDTGRTHIAYGIKNPGNVEFQIYFGTLWSAHYYIEASHDQTMYDLPQDLSQYTELVPGSDFQYFTARRGKYPIKLGWKGDQEPEIDPTPCVASYLLGESDPRLDILRTFRDEKMTAFETGSNMIVLYYEKSDSIIAVCEKNPLLKRSLKLILETIIPVISISLITS